MIFLTCLASIHFSAMRMQVRTQKLQTAQNKNSFSDLIHLIQMLQMHALRPLRLLQQNQIIEKPLLLRHGRMIRRRVSASEIHACQRFLQITTSTRWQGWISPHRFHWMCHLARCRR